MRSVVISARLGQSANALLPISLRLVLKSILLRFLQPVKAEVPIRIIPEGMLTPLSDEHPAKHRSGISVIPLGIEALISFEHPEKHAVPIDATESGIEIVTTCVLP